MAANAKSLTVIFEDGVDLDHAGRISESIKMFRGVLAVATEEVATDEMWAVERAKQQLREEIRKVVYPSC